MKQAWSVAGNSWFLSSYSEQNSKLLPEHYILNESQTGFFLQHVAKEFEFDYKIYGTETKFINRVIKTYKETSGNLGILLNGIKGTGKTVTAEQICNKLKLPVLIISKTFDGNLAEYLSSINQDLIIFIDEHDKIFKHNYSVLTLMDGVLSNKFRRLFLLTSNKDYLNENMKSRPSRVRYVKQFGDLSPEVVEEIIDDMLVHKQYKTELLSFIAKLEIITIDIVKSLISEVNIHNESPNEFGEVFNTRRASSTFKVYKNINNQKQLFKENAKVTPKYITEDEIGNGFHIDGDYLGSITKVDGQWITTECWVDEEENKGLIRKFKEEEFFLEPNVKIHKSYAKVF